MLKLLIFIVISAGLVYISRTSLRAIGSHGFYRFFAWETMAVLFLLNVELWFSDPLAWYQLISWVLLLGSLIPLYFGVRTLVGRGKPVTRREEEPQLLAFEKTSTLVTTGIYHYIRHPMYSSLLLLAWGIFFKSPGWFGLALAALATLFLFLTARADEAECLRFFGPAYGEYMRHTKRFLPNIF